MREYVTRAVILEKEPQGEFDASVVFWSRELGRMRGRAVSLRKITSKLSAHLEPGLVSELRLVENRSLRIVDALKMRRLDIAPADLRHLTHLLAEGGPDDELWGVVTAREWSWGGVLRILGWDPTHADCVLCGLTPDGFSVASQDFFCSGCASKLPPDALIFL